jgi:DNA repair exonuclease SbcCD ATPase subunit
MNYTILLDMILIAFLATTIGYAVVLNRKLTALRRHKAELQQLAATFTQATQKAEASITRVSTGTEALQERLAKAQGLRDDLAFLIERANSAADRLEGTIRAARPKPATGPVLATAAHAPGNSKHDEDGIEPRSEAERELLKVFRAAG